MVAARGVLSNALGHLTEAHEMEGSILPVPHSRAGWRCWNRVLGVGGTLVSLLVACDGGNALFDDVSVRDSSGIRVVEFGVGARAATGTWRLASQPDIALDNREDNALFQFFRVVDVLPLPDGGLAVANAGTSEIRIFNAEGQYVRTVGRSGEGPGEFRSISWIALRPPDSIVAGDIRLRRITVFDGRGNYVRTATTLGSSRDDTRAALAAPEPLGLFGDASFLAVSYDGPAAVAGPARPAARLLHYTPDATSSDLLGSWPGNELYLLGDGARLGVFTPPFQRITRFVVGSEQFWIGDSDRWELRSYSPTGQLLTLVRRAGGDVTVTDALLERVINERYRDVADGPDRAQMVARQKQMVRHATTPSFGDLQIGTDGRLWVGAYPLPGDTTVLWTGIDPDGTLTAYGTVPRRFQVLRFGSDFVIVLIRDHLERESIRLYSMVGQ